MSVKTLYQRGEDIVRVKYCHDHMGRIAAYQLLTPAAKPDLFYCEKCSIKLASQGHTVLRLNPTPTRRISTLVKEDKPKWLDPKALRRADTQRFLMSLKDTRKDL